MTNAIPYFDKLVQLNDSLAGAPSGLLVFALCISAGYVWKMIRVLPNRFIPLIVMLTGAGLHLVMTWTPDQTRQVTARTLVVGFIIGFLAWLFHRLLLKKLEDKFGVNISENDTTIFEKPSEPKDRYDPNKP